MYKDYSEYLDAFRAAGINKGDRVNIYRKPCREDGVAYPFDSHMLWSAYYKIYAYPIGEHIVRHVDNVRGLLSMVDCNYLLPFFVCEEFDRSSLQMMSKSNFLKFDRLVQELSYV